MRFMQGMNCLIQVLMGAVSGYYTNKLAISHLFTDIPLPGGNPWKAVIKKGGNKERLAEDLSEIAQDKILGTSVEKNGETKRDSYFYQELSKKETEDALSRCVEEILKELSESSIAKKTLAEVVSDMLQQDRGQYRLLEHSLLTAAGDLTLGDLIGEKAFTEFCEELWRGQFGFTESGLRTTENLEKTDGMQKKESLQKAGSLEAFLEQALLELSEGGELTLEAVFGTGCCEQAERVLTEKICNVFGETLFPQESHTQQDGRGQNGKENREWNDKRSLLTESGRLKLEGYLQSICRQLGFGTMVRKFLVSLREKTVGDLLSKEGEVWLSETLCALLEEPQIQENLKKFFAVLAEMIKQADWTLSDLLPEGCLGQEGFLEILKEQLQNLQPFAAVFYEDNEEFLAERLKFELGAVIDGGTGNFIQNMVLFSAKDTILEKLEEFLKEKMPGKLEQFLADPPEEACREICHGISQIRVAFLVDHMTFEQALLFLKKVCLFGKEDTGISGYVIKNIRKLSLASVLSYDIIDVLSKKADTVLMDMISEWLKGKEKKGQIEAAVHFLFGKLITKPFGRQEAEQIGRAFREKNLAEKISGWFFRHFGKEEALPDGNGNLLGYGKEGKHGWFFSWVYGQISGIMLRDMQKQFLPEPQVLLERLMETYGRRASVGDLISSVPKEPLKKKIYGKFLEKAVDYLPIKAIVKEQVQAMDEDTLCTMMQKFMGTQLKPLNRIGGALGAMVGLLVWAVNPSMEMSLPAVFAGVVSYGLIGIVTNVLALRGLFRPYHIEERAWLGRLAKKDGILSGAVMGIYHVFSKIPGVRNLVCLGYLPEHKEMMAKRLAEFVAGNFLQPKDLLPEIVIKPEMVRGFLQEHKDKIAEKATEALKKADKRKLAARIEQGISNGNFAEALTGKIKAMDLSFVAEKIYPQLETCKGKSLGTYLDSETMAAFMTEVLQKQAGNIVDGLRLDLEKQSEVSSGSRQVLIEPLHNFCEKKLKDKTAEEAFCAYFSEGGELSAQKGSEFLLSCLYGEGLWNKLADMLSGAVGVLEGQKEKTLGDFFAQMARDHGGSALSGVQETVRDDTGAADFDRLFEEKEPAVSRWLLAIIKDALQKYLEKNEEKLVDKLDLEVQDMISGMAEGVPLGGMAASMLGTRQIIAKVVHRALIDPQPLEAENQWTYGQETSPREVILRERLLEELVDRNEEILLKKIGEIIRRQMKMRTAGELWELLGMGEGTVREQWSRRICQMLSSAWQQGKEQSMAAEALFGDIVSFAGNCTVEEYLGLLRKEFVRETLEQTVFSEVLLAVQKPSVGTACKDFFRYGMDGLLSMPCDMVLSVVTEPVLADALNLFWKRLGSLPCVSSLCSEILTAKHIECRKDGSDSMSVLLKEALDALWQKENVWNASRECLDGGIGILLECLENGQEKKDGEHSDVENDRLQGVFMEILGSLEEALRYDNTDRAGLADVAGQIDFERIIRLAVMDMTDAQMEALFQGFAGRYFLSLKLSGGLGFVFGVPVLKYAAAAAALGSEFTGKRKE